MGVYSLHAAHVARKHSLRGTGRLRTCSTGSKRTDGGWVRVVKGDSPAAADTKRVRGPIHHGARVVGRRGVWQVEQH